MPLQAEDPVDLTQEWTKTRPHSQHWALEPPKSPRCWGPRELGLEGCPHLKAVWLRRQLVAKKKKVTILTRTA
jgi:hypothetical protein